MTRKLILGVLGGALAANAFALPLLHCDADKAPAPASKVVTVPLLSSAPALLAVNRASS